MVFEFNTGREYSLHGQTIFVRYDEAGRATFADLTRGVAGEMAVPGNLSRGEAQGAVLALYDKGLYALTCAADAFMRRAREWADDPSEPLEWFMCPGHEWAYTGTAYGGDDESHHGEGRCYCALCGADGDA